MNVPKQAVWKIAIGCVFIVLGILEKRLFHSQFLTLTFHLAGALMIAAGLLQWLTERK